MRAQIAARSAEEPIGTILIVDDLPGHREILAILLREQGHRILEAGDGRTGLAAVRAERPDLVITDVLMPLMDGYDFVRQLRLDSATRLLPVVFYTAYYSEHEARELALSIGVSWVLSKPSASAEVLRVVGLALSGKVENGARPLAAPGTIEAGHAHLRLLTDKLSKKADNLVSANARLRALINIGLEISATRDPERLLRHVCDETCDLFSATYVTAGVVDLVNRTLRRVAACGALPAEWIQEGNALSGFLDRVVSCGRPLRGENPGGDPASMGLPSSHPEVRAYLAVPITSREHVYGWICLARDEERPFSEEDEDLVMSLAVQVGGIYELEHEVVERREAESALRREHDRSRRYLDTAEVMLVALDLEGRVTLVNRYACDVLGWTAVELIGCDWIDACIPVRLRDDLRARLGNLLRGDLTTNKNPVLTRNGEERLIQWRNTLLRDDLGQVSGSLSSGTDITEQEEAGAALHIAEERMRFALEAARVGIWDQDFVTGELTWSSVLQAQYGLPPGTFGGTFESFTGLVHPEDLEGVLETIRRAMTSGTDFTTDHRTIWQDGSVHWLSGAGRVFLDAQGRPERAIGISLDVTERRNLEAQYRQSQKMEAIGQLAGGVAHDFNNLLTAILGYCELIMGDLDPADPHRDDIGEIYRAGISAAALTRQLLAFSRKQILEPKLLNLNVVVEGMRKLLDRLIGEHIKVGLVIRPGLAPVKADRAQVEQIILNLVLNARDAMPTGGSLTIETANVTLDEHYRATHIEVKPGSYVCLTVSDTGTGMTPQVLSRLFEPFFTTKPIGKGTGLGLATIHGIVKQSGGSVNVYSEVGRGTSFKVYLPKADATEIAAAEPVPAARSDPRAETVLVVEDAEGLRELTRRLLERQGYTVLVAGDSSEAVLLFDQHPEIDLLLTDIVLPGGGGVELSRRLVERRPELKVIYMSGYTEDAIVQHGVLAAGIAFLHKPFTMDSLAGKIREVLDLQPVP